MLLCPQVAMEAEGMRGSQAWRALDRVGHGLVFQ